MAESTEPIPVERSAKYWLDHGDVILQVESVQFRLNKSTLAFHSPVFRDMFSLPLPPDKPLIDNCPVVVLSGDRSADWLELLDVLFPRLCFVETHPNLDQIIALLRLSKKYEIKGFQHQCVERLRANFPSTLDGYKEVETQWKDIDVPEPEDGVDLPELAVKVVNVAREVGLHSVLPVAFYTIIASSVGAATDNENILKLELCDQRACYKGFIQVTKDYLRTPFKCFEPGKYIPCEACEREPRCNSIGLLLKLGLENNRHSMANIVGKWDDEWDEQFCPACVGCAKEVFERAREKCWDKLPSYFGLPDWEELKRMDIE
uniref:BTB domain-containing protein n=1 Tax=Mycena chlorophos TaxID=658473 RepID=A0ABQ0L042_MYCCL|nr:predicted protein [Mycena chlorophos]